MLYIGNITTVIQQQSDPVFKEREKQTCLDEFIVQ